MRISDWSSDVCSSVLLADLVGDLVGRSDQDIRRTLAERDEPFVPEPHMLFHQLFGAFLVAGEHQEAAPCGGIGTGDLAAVLGGMTDIALDRTSVVEGKSVSVRVDIGGRGNIKK